ncbi:ABC ATPase [Cryptosporidium ubiquitum]|uniref:ABC ATPase n=1 Tax=Cryptosporidium ubiquitum TaxID=857276 RepID=A0A1J4MQ49_9CRYT|nr:ABC ATPase [Cryptosporidium ubiquitum]OII75013.1 ABC ATPase [Cryptosporidium ubiquitum]
MLGGIFSGSGSKKENDNKVQDKKPFLIKKTGGITPEESASLWSKFTFSWFTPIIDSACDHILSLDEYYHLPEHDNPSYSLNKFENKWKVECETFGKTKGFRNDNSEKPNIYGSFKRNKFKLPSLARVLLQCYSKQIFIILILVILSNICNMTQIVILRKLLECIQSSETIPRVDTSTESIIPWWALILGIVPQRFNSSIAYKGFAYIFAMTILIIAYAFLRQQETRMVTQLGRRIRSLITGVVYRKLLNLDSNIFSESSQSNFELGSRVSKARLSVVSEMSYEGAVESFGMSGNVVNLLSNDVSRFGRLYICHEFYYGVCSITIATILLYANIGISGIVGILVMFAHAAWSINFLNARAFVRKSFSEIRDRRILLTSEYLNFIKIIKSYSWERYFINNIDSQRKNELSSLLAQAVYWGLATACHAVVFHAVLFTVLIRRYLGEVVDPANIFFAYVIYDAVSEFIASFPKSYALFRDIILSCERVSEFLVIEDRDNNINQIIGGSHCSTIQPVSPIQNQDPLELQPGNVRYEGVELRWPNGSVLLKDLSFEVRPGEMMAILGPVGSGKSGLLLSIINELQHSKGLRRIDGKVAYIPQLAWAITGTIRENILFGAPFDPKWYAQVVNACCLTADFKTFPKGDQTMIGGSSNNLSGGQRQRISLARAVYQRSQIYALDDCLSAVDSNVSAKIFKNCILGLLRDKCVILATHLAELVIHVDKVLLLDEINKRPLYIGDPCGLLKFPHYENLFSMNPTSSNNNNQNNRRPLLNNNSGETLMDASTIRSESTPSYISDDIAVTDEEIESLRLRKYEDDEEEEEGVVSLETYMKYILSYKKSNIIILIILVSLLVAFYVLTTFFIGIWVENFNAKDWKTYFYIYLAACILLPICCIFTTIYFRIGGFEVSKIYHNKLLSHIEHAPLSFFQNTPIGRILNRFTSDLVHIDELLPTSFNNSSVTVLMSLTMLVSIGIVTPQFIAFIPPIFYAFYYVARKYPPILRQSERRSAALTAPITSQLMETMSGLATIHTFEAENMLIKKMEDAIIALNNIRYHLDIAYIWLYLRLEVIGCMTLVITGVFSVLLSACNMSNSGILGTILSFAVAMPGWLRYSIFTLGELEADMVGFERIRTYTDSEMYQIVTLDNEENNIEVSKDWPSQGKIEFRNVDVTFYPNSNPSLCNICLQISPGERIGIVGRTGAGKSSLFSTLLRLFDPSFGTILIDDVETLKVSPLKLRSSISIVPQEPVIFTGTVRFNLDPKGSYSDKELYQVLKRAHIFEYVNNLPGKLDYQLEGGGSQLSVGIKQLFCLTRAILRKSKILLLDEATSFVDIQTDSLIQETIRSEFKGCTILTIAHRIKTIINYDKILVLDSGRVFEFDTPQNLLRNPKSVFSSLASSVFV